MTQFTSMLDDLAHAVQTLADGGGPFWDKNAQPASNPPPAETVDSEEQAPIPQRSS